MSRRATFTVDDALAALLLEDEEEFVRSVALDGPPVQNVLGESDDDDDDSSDSHFLDKELDIDIAAHRYDELSSTDDGDGEEETSDTDDVFEDLDAGMDVPQHAATAATVLPRCGCSKNCLSLFSIEDVDQNRLNMAELERPDFDLLLSGVLEAMHCGDKLTVHQKKRKRSAFKYAFQSKRVCAGAFRYIFNIKKDKLWSLCKHVESNGATARRHGNAGRRPSNAFTFEEVKYAVTFIKSHGEHYGIPHPAPLHGRDGVPPVFLPASQTYKAVHKLYVTAGNSAGIRVMGESSFRSIWHQCTPHLKFMSPRTDVCDLCEKLRRRVMSALTEQDKVAACSALQDHIAAAQHERDYYRGATISAAEQLQASAQCAPPCAPCSQATFKTHYTFDFAQNVSIPQEWRQVGPLYFKVPRKVQVFGVNNEAVPHQVNYLIDETDTIGTNGSKSHGPNSVVSLLHHFFAHHGYGEEQCILSADNCCGQNKNKTVVSYLAWRCMSGLHKCIELHFMITGHTRCLVDGCFGLLKRSYRRNNIYSMAQLADVVNGSAACNQAQLIPGSNLEWREWDKFFMQFFKPLVGISKLHYMRFSSAEPGVVYCKENVHAAEQRLALLKVPAEDLLRAGLPKVLSPAGLTAERQQYLFSHIREHVPSEFQDEVCPPPTASAE
eukprot:scpid38438/ scgid5141/ 